MGIFPTRIWYWLVTNESALDFFSSVNKIYLKRGEFLRYYTSLTCCVSNTVPGEAERDPASHFYSFHIFQQSIIKAYPCICNVTNTKTTKEAHWSSSRMRHSEVMKCWNLHSSLFALYFMMQFIIMWWDNIFTQVHSSFQIENG